MGFMSALAPVFSVAGSLISASANASAASYQSAIASMNAKIAEQNAQQERERAALEAQKSDQEARQLMGEQRALQGASGISMDSRSQMLTRKSASQVARMDALNIATEGESNARNLENQASAYGVQSKMYKSAAKYAMIGGVFDAAGKGISGFKSYIASATPTRSSFS